MLNTSSFGRYSAANIEEMNVSNFAVSDNEHEEASEFWGSVRKSKKGKGCLIKQLLLSRHVQAV